MNSDGKWSVAQIALAGILSATMMGCATGRVDGETALAANSSGNPTMAPPAPLDPSLYGCSFPVVPHVLFDYDSSLLRPDAFETLERVAKLIKEDTSVTVQIEGHCDDRGTQEYNLALGEQRAIAVKEALIRLGIDPEKLDTISFGEESPAVPNDNESGWALNRRAVFVASYPPASN